MFHLIFTQIFIECEAEHFCLSSIISFIFFHITLKSVTFTIYVAHVGEAKCVRFSFRFFFFLSFSIVNINEKQAEEMMIFGIGYLDKIVKIEKR